MNIIPVTKGDLPYISNILGQSYPRKEDVDYFTGIIEDTLTDNSQDKTETYIVAKDQNGVVVGLLGYRKLLNKFKKFSNNSNPIEIYSLFVDVDYRRKGIGKNSLVT